ncbi:hypothetical protein ACWDR1_04625 [Streptosporangium sandarakinum]
MTNTTPKSWKISLLGGVKQRGPQRLPEHLVVVTAVGGADLDLTGAAFSGGRFTLTKVSFAGGVKLTVPVGVRVEVEGFHLFGGHRVEQGAGAPDGPVVTVRAYGVFGGVRVGRSS